MKHLPLTITITAAFLLPSCSTEATTGAGPTIRVALDQQFSQPLLNGFADELGIAIHQMHDTEGAKTVGHTSAIKTEASAPRCSIFWNNELANTIHLAHLGLVEPYVSPAAKDIPARWKDAGGMWTGFGARARILIVNTDLVPDKSEWPSSYQDLVDPKWKGRCAIAKPLTGTTLTHFAALRKELGTEQLDELFDQMEQNDVKFLASNGATMNQVREGKLAWAFTDTDDYNVCKSKGFPVACVYPDQGEGQIGTMLIPNSVCLVKGGPDLEAAKKLVDKILARSTEEALAASRSAQIPVREGIQGPSNAEVLTIGKFREMDWDPQWVGENLAECTAAFAKRFQL